MRFKRRHWVTVVYSSGTKVRFKTANVEVRHSPTGIAEIGWTDATPKPVYIGVNDVIAIYKGRA